MVEWVLLVLQSVKVRKGRQEHNQWPVAATSSPNAGPPPVDIINLWGLTQGRHISVTSCALDHSMSCGSCGWLTLTKQIVRKDPTT